MNTSSWQSNAFIRVILALRCLMAVYNSIEKDRTSACEGASGCRYQSIFHLTHPPNPCMKCEMKLEIEGSLTSPANHVTLKMQEKGSTVYSPYPRKLEWLSNHLQRQQILLSYFKTLSVGPVWGLNLRPPAQQTGPLPTELTSRQLWDILRRSGWITSCLLKFYSINVVYVDDTFCLFRTKNDSRSFVF